MLRRLRLFTRVRSDALAFQGRSYDRASPINVDRGCRYGSAVECVAHQASGGVTRREVSEQDDVPGRM